jgi:SAM-dependent methyltransferase
MCIRDGRETRRMVHEVAAAGFGDAADYEAARPSYPPEAVAWFVEHLRIAPGARVVDLAAGTGKLTRLLAPAGARLVAAEPVAGMRELFHSSVPGVPQLACTAERLAFRDASLDAVTVAQAFHWFDHERAIAELARVLRPGGRVGLVWNARDRSVDWVDGVWSIMDRVEKRAPWRDHDEWRDSAYRDLPGFGELHTAQFRHTHTLTPEAMVRRVASVSHVAVLPDAERAGVLGEVRDLLATHPATAGRVDLAVPYRVDCFWFERIVPAD